MPELPEVETIKNELAPYVVGRCITGVTIIRREVLGKLSAEELQQRIVGQTVRGLRRRGKYLIWELSNGEYMVIHLRMTGSLWLEEPDGGRFVRVVICLDNGTNIYFRDPRHFGRIRLVKDISEITDKLGPEPLEPDFTPDVLAKLMARRKAHIKAVLLEQNIIAGIGNMYADEALYAARIHPLRLASSLTRDEIERLHQAIIAVLKSGIKNKGASVETYYRPGGEEGKAQTQFKVAHRLGGPDCPVCGGKVERITVRGRGTYFCPRCQPEP